MTRNVLYLFSKQEGNADPAFDIFLLIFQHKWMFLSTMQSVIVCEYVVNLSTFEKVITEKQNFYTNC